MNLIRCCLGACVFWSANSEAIQLAREQSGEFIRQFVLQLHQRFELMTLDGRLRVRGYDEPFFPADFIPPHIDPFLVREECILACPHS